MKSNETCVAEIEISYRPSIGNKPIVKSSFDAFKELFQFFNQETMFLQEEFAVMYLNRQKRVLGIYRLSKGGLSATIADVRLILGIALKTAASGIILAHNHPSCNLTPSSSDIEMTRKIKSAAHIMDIEMIDHLIISGCNKYLSICDEGYL